MFPLKGPICLGSPYNIKYWGFVEVAGTLVVGSTNPMTYSSNWLLFNDTNLQTISVDGADCLLK